MTEAHALLDALSSDDARAALFRCCGSTRWVEGMLARRPYRSNHALESAAAEVWSALGAEDVLEALSHHPAIGADLDALAAKFSSTAAWSGSEQAGAARADRATLGALAAANRAYHERFGFTFVICATGKSAGEMLEALERRLANERATELAVAAREQAAITQLRLAKLALEAKGSA